VLPLPLLQGIDTWDIQVFCEISPDYNSSAERTLVKSYRHGEKDGRGTEFIQVRATSPPPAYPLLAM
jgi:hypothetical protein